MQNGRLTISINGRWRNCLMLNLCVKDGKLVFPKSQSSYGSFETGVVITCPIDSNEQDYYWENLKIDAEMPENSVLRVSCYVSESTKAEVDGRIVDLDSYIKTQALLPDEEKKKCVKALDPLFLPAFSGGSDGIVNQKGRYLFIKAEFLVPDTAGFSVNAIEIVYQSERLIQYLPQIYRDHEEDNRFFRRYLNIFESIFFDIEQKVENTAKSFDYGCASGEMLRFLASWICVDGGNSELKRFNDKELRQRISGAVREYGEIGTKKGVEDFVKRELGVRPIIVEYFKVKKAVREGRDKEVYRELFGDNPYCFFLLLPEEAFSGHSDMTRFINELRMNIPAQTEVRLVLLKKRIVLGKHTYLGVNSVVGDYSYVSIDQNVSISNETMIGGDSNEKQ